MQDVAGLTATRPPHTVPCEHAARVSRAAGPAWLAAAAAEGCALRGGACTHPSAAEANLEAAMHRHRPADKANIAVPGARGHRPSQSAGLLRAPHWRAPAVGGGHMPSRAS